MDYNGRIERSKERLKDNDDILEENKETLLEFDDHMIMKDNTPARRYKYLCKIPKMAEILDKPFEDATKEDIKKIRLYIKKRDDITDVTKGDYEVLLKRFYKFVGDGEYPKCVEDIETTNKVDSDKAHEELLTEDDVLTLIEACQNKRDKALISLTYETGARASELLDLDVGSVEDRERGLKIVVDGKTGRRRIPLVSSVPYLKQWIEDHPNGDDKNAPLFCNIGKVNNGDRMKYGAFRKTLIDVRKRTDIDKPVNPHHWRHSRATDLASKFTEAQLCLFFGWKQGSDVPAQYVHMSGRDLDDDYDKLHGMEPEEEPDKSKLVGDSCPRCNEQLEKDAEFCYKCGQRLTEAPPEQWEEVNPNFSKEIQKDLMRHSMIEELKEKDAPEELIKSLRDKIKHKEALTEVIEELESDTEVVLDQLEDGTIVEKEIKKR